MKSFKKVLRLLGFIVLIVFASFGVGLSGGAIVPQMSRKKDSPIIHIELVESNDEESEENQFDTKQE